MQTSSATRFWARIPRTCSRRLRVHSEAILVTIALIAGGQSETLPQMSRIAKYPNTDKCLTAVAFYRLRRASQEFGFPRSTVRPATPVSKLLPWMNRRMRWQQMQDQLGLELGAALSALGASSCFVRTRNHPLLHEGVLGNPAQRPRDSRLIDSFSSFLRSVRQYHLHAHSRRGAIRAEDSPKSSWR